MSKHNLAFIILIIVHLTALSGNTFLPRNTQINSAHEQINILKQSQQQISNRQFQYCLLSSRAWSHLSAVRNNRGEKRPGILDFEKAITDRDPLQILVNGSDYTSIIQGNDMLITVSFSEGSAEADINMWIDMNADALLEPEIDIDIEEPLHFIDGDEFDEDPAPGIYQFTYSGNDGVSMIADIGVLVAAEDAGGSATAFVHIEPLQTDYSVSGQVSPANSNLIILALPLEPPSEELVLTVTDTAGNYEIFVPTAGYYLIALIDFLDVLAGQWMAEANYVEYVDGQLGGYDFTLQQVTGGISGQLTDQDGFPVTGIEIQAFRADATLPFPLAMTETDEAGNYSLGVYAADWVAAVNGDYIVPDYLVPPPSGVLTITPGDTLNLDFQIFVTDDFISGTVYLDNLPFEQGAVIQAESVLGSSLTNSNAGGAYSLPVSGLADELDGYTISIDENELPDGIFSQEHFTGVTSGSTGIDFHLFTFSGGLSGTIYDGTTYAPVPDAQLHVVNPDTEQHFPGISDEDGNFEIALPAGNFILFVFSEGYYNHVTQDLEVVDDFITLSVFLEPLVLTGSVFGYVSDADTGNPLANIPISVNLGFEENWFSADTISAADGYYSFEVPNGTLFIQATLEGWVQLGDSFVTVENDQVQQDLVLAPLSGAIQGTVTDAVTGLPVTGVWVYADNGIQDWGSGINSTEDGSYMIALINGVYIVTAEQEGYLPFVSADIEVQDDMIMLDIVLTPTIPPQLGDVNGDQFVNVLDIVLIVSFILENQDPSPQQVWAADVNGDGAINVLDIVNLVDIILNGP